MGSLKTLSTVVLALFTVITATARAQQAQSDEVKQLIQNRDHKLSAPFLRSANWNTSYEDAKKAAEASGKLILGYFTRSYAPCGPCMQLEQTVFQKPEFVEYSRNVVLYLHISTRIPGEANGTLFAEKGGNAFPTLMVMDKDGNVLARQCGERSMSVVRGVVTEGQGFKALIDRCTPHPVQSGDGKAIGVLGERRGALRVPLQADPVRALRSGRRAGEGEGSRQPLRRSQGLVRSGDRLARVHDGAPRDPQGRRMSAASIRLPRSSSR